ncbi:lysophospholipid acyltransferase family protein [Leptospira perolatii]|uniref:lysophospholipid acyltransferase family protein n=1 Tax=Leptospira perolatii TaxID=2023191 RepID=UPI001A9C38EF|nr:lysophospholipid acyltransferase family protein [Leptospira perolatii]
MKSYLITRIVYYLLKLIYFSIRWKLEDPPQKTAEFLKARKGFLVALWHYEIFTMIYVIAYSLQKKFKLKIVPLASQSEDAEMLVKILDSFKIHTKRGSSKRGGAAGLKALVKEAMSGSVSLITPDGPTGPALELKLGVVTLGSLTGYPIISYTAQIDRYWTLKSWDRVRIPKPFAKVTFKFSEPFYVPKLKGEKDTEKWRKKLETFMLSHSGISFPEAEDLREEVRLHKEMRMHRNASKLGSVETPVNDKNSRKQQI